VRYLPLLKYTGRIQIEITPESNGGTDLERERGQVDERL